MRALRRAQMDTRKKRALRKLMGWGCSITQRAVGMRATTPKLCSCFVCSGRKRWVSGPTMRERKWQE